MVYHSFSARPARQPEAVRYTNVMSVVVAVVFALAAGQPAQRGACATLAARDLPAQALATVGFGARPDVVDFADSTLHPVRVHRSAGALPEQAALVMQEADAAWALQVDGAGFDAPLADDDGSFVDDDGGDGRLDIYLDALGPGIGAITISGGTASRRPVFISIDPQQVDEVVAVAVHHEFQHALQFAVDARESVMWFESNAVAWEVKGRPDVDAWLEVLPSFQVQPQAPIFTDSASFDPFSVVDAPTFEYGAAFFVLYLDEVKGAGDGRFLQSLWAGSAQAGEVNEPDWLDVLIDQTGDDDIFGEFGVARVNAGDLVVDDAFFVVADGRSTVGAKAIDVGNLRGVERTTSSAEGPFVGGCAMFKGAAPDDEDVPVRVAAVSDIGHDIEAFVVVVDNGVAETVVSGIGDDVAAVAVVGAGAAVVMGVCDVSAADADDAPVFAPVRLTLSRTDVDPVGEGEGENSGEGEGEGEGEGVVDCGCGCQQAPVDSGADRAPGNPLTMRKNIGGLGFLVGVFAFGLRAFRHWKRKQLYKNKT